MAGEDSHLEEQYEDRFVEPELEDEDGYDFEPDPEVEDRKKILEEVMERHPDFAFTGNSVQDYLYNDGELESATIDDPMRGEW